MAPIITDRAMSAHFIRPFQGRLGFGHFTKTFVSQNVVWIHSFEPMMRNCVQRNKIAELVLGAPRETAEMANPQTQGCTLGYHLSPL
jgi:hypothetical protein